MIDVSLSRWIKQSIDRHIDKVSQLFGSTLSNQINHPDLLNEWPNFFLDHFENKMDQLNFRVVWASISLIMVNNVILSRSDDGRCFTSTELP